MLRGQQKSPSASKSALLLSPCLYWASSGADWFDESKVDKEDTQKRDDGTVFHGWMDAYVKGQLGKQAQCSTPENQLKYLAMYQHAVEWLEEHNWSSPDLRSEVAYRIGFSDDPPTELPGISNREYPKEPNTMFGTADMVYDNGYELIVGDWKTGESDGSKEQLMTLLGAAWAQVWQGNIRSTRRLLTVCLSVNEHGVFPEYHEYTEAELEEHISSLRRVWSVKDHITGQALGIHCTKLYCPALAYCPAIEKETNQMAVDSELGTTPLIKPSDLNRANRKVTDEPLTDTDAGYTMAVVAAARRRANYLQDGVKKYLAKGGKALLDGYEWSEGGNGYRWRKS